MILQALVDYYRRKVADPDPACRLPAYGLEEKEIPFVIQIDAAGRWVPPIRDTRRKDGKKVVGQRFLVPAAVKRSSGVAANLLWDTAEYVLGVDIRGKSERVAAQHAAFRARIEALPEPAASLPGVVAARKFLAAVDLAAFAHDPLWPEILASNPFVALQLQGEIELICQHPAIALAAVGGGEEDSETVFCLVTGTPATMERLHARINGVWGAQSSGANIVSFNLDAFNSYGKRQGANAPVGKPAAFAYTTALNHLLGRASRQRVQIGDASTVFWAEKPSEFETLVPDLFGEPPKDDPDRGTRALDTLYRSLHTGHFVSDDDDSRFHVLGLAPNAARIAVRFWQTGTVAELGHRLRRHFDDLDVVRGPNDPRHLSLFRLLTAISVQGKADNIPPNLGGEIVRAVLNGEDTPYPAALLNGAVGRCRAEQRVTHARAALLKACLNREIRRANRRYPSTPEKEFMPMLDTDNPSPAYRLGRLFAVMEKIQEEASPGLNATIRDRYYGAASSSPVAVFTTLLRLKNHHLGKLTAGRRIYFERLIGEIMDNLADLPRQLPLPEQGRFALGYYHQRQDFFTRKSDSDTSEGGTQ
ncbi:MAG: type I-C CRISPR-associated protein Cas8c/Csd1 [Rhodocyclaceae bacterium]|jgi:CRISPR-associated protein Csd1|nr:type I-C CRISPR-associated protein Cas8c/Csd1 [Rhodocyclaceae bacterium]